MSDYTETFTAVTGDTIDAADFEAEFDAIATAIATKLDADGSGTMSGALAMGANKITGLADPTNDQDAATKAYVDAAIQTVEATPYTTRTDISTVFPTDNTIPQNTEGFEVTTVTITPTSATNRLVIEAECFGAIGGSGVGAAGIGIFQDATAGALAAGIAGGPATAVLTLRLRHEMAAGTTSATTFKMRVGPNSTAVNFYINGTSAGALFGGVAAARLRVTEYRT